MVLTQIRRGLIALKLSTGGYSDQPQIEGYKPNPYSLLCIQNF